VNTSRVKLVISQKTDKEDYKRLESV